jgi:hypothetical protein
MGAQLASTVYVTDPQTSQTVCLAPGTLPEPHLAALVTNPSAWVDGKLPSLASDSSGDADSQSSEAEPVQGADAADTKPAAKRQVAKKTAASKTAAN